MHTSTCLKLLDAQRIEAHGKLWCFDPFFETAILFAGGEQVPFSAAQEKREQPIQTGLGDGIRLTWSQFPGHGDLTLEADILLVGDRADFSLVTVREGRGTIQEIAWPAPLMADDAADYAVVNTMQGQLIPSHWPEQVAEKLPFDGQMCSEAAYMPWWGEVTEQGSYLAVVQSPWDTKYTIRHPAGGPNRIYARHLPSLGRMRYQRTVSYYFLPAGSDYGTLCRTYRHIADEKGTPMTLREKAAENPNVDRLIGCGVMHVDGKTHVTPDSRYYNQEAPEKNERLVPFAHWEERVRMLKEKGVTQLYLHQDGWGQPGYDNQHPDYLPPCRELGGWDGLRALSETVTGLGYLMGLHDQYRDYYLDAPTYSADSACQNPDGSIYGHAIWAGGRQNYLCASLAPDYVKRNFDQLFAAGIQLQATYLDVFTCNEADECANPRHPMTRAQCLQYRAQCFHYLTAHGVVPSSEEVNDWAMRSQVFCHWAPYLTGSAIPVPLFNLTYHDCVMIPWKMDAGEWGIPEGTTGFMHALLNGGMGYISDQAEGEALARNIAQWRILSRLQKQVAYEKMTEHAFLTPDRNRQETVFSDGTRVTVDFATNGFRIVYPDGEVVDGEADSF